jgi:hypothetical protein
MPLVLAAPAVSAAVFVPGAAPDPPTGEVSPPAAPSAAEPLRGSGFQWVVPRGRVSSLLALDGRWFRYEEGLGNQQLALSGQVDWASYLWQPWFMQLQAGIGFVALRDRADGGDSADGVVVADTAALTGRIGLQLFPASRFPLDFYADVSDNRAGGDVLSGVLRSQRAWLTQSYQPQQGSQTYQLQLNYSRLDTATGSDTLYTGQALASVQAGAHQFDAAATLADNRLGGSGQRSRVVAASAHHGYFGGGPLTTDTVLNWNNVELDGSDAPDALASVSSDVRQIASVFTWYPLAGSTAIDPGDGTPPVVVASSGSLLVSGTARYAETSLGGAVAGPTVRSLNASLGASQDLSPAWRVAASGSAGWVASGENELGALGARATLTWSPPGLSIAQWRYTPSVSAGAGLASETDRGVRHFVGGQASQTFSRDLPIGDSQMLSLTLAQSYGLIRESETERVAQGVANTLGVAWQAYTDGGSQQYASLSLSDSRAWAEGSGSFQMVNLQVSQRSQLSRFASLMVALSAQATNSSATVIDPFTGAVRTVSDGWQSFYNGSLVLEQGNVFGVRRLRHTLLLSLASQQIQSRTFGDIEASTQFISRSIESRLDWQIGRLQARLSAQAARVDNRAVAGIVFRVQRNF